MQVDSTPQFSPPTPAPSHSSPPQQHAQLQQPYTFPPSKSGSPEPARSASPSDFSALSEYGGEDGQGQKARTDSSGQQSQSSYDPSGAPTNHRGSIPTGMVASYGSHDRVYSAPESSSAPPPGEYSALAREIMSSGSAQRVVDGYGAGFNGTPNYALPHPGQAPPGSYALPPPSQYHAQPLPPDFLQRPAGHMYSAPPQFQPHTHWAPPPGPGQSLHSHHAQMMGYPQPLAPNGSMMRYAPYPGGPGQPFFTPYQPHNLMARTTSADSSNTTASHLSDSENRSWSSSQDHSDYEGAGVCNPAYINPNASTSSMPDAHGAHFYHPGDPRALFSRSTGDLHALRLEEGMDGNATIRGRGVHRDATIRGGRFTGAVTRKPSTRNTARTIFHPTPQSMLAPAIANARREGNFTGSTTPTLPTDDEFLRLPTKRSRGRRPPCTPDLSLSADPNNNPSEAQIRYCGVTKTGKPKKVFICKVPACGKCFKRSEHLKRHVRSIHTSEKPFQCQWPGCQKYFSRHDNLNQHLRIHRAPNQSDAAFSLQLEQCFGRSMEERQGISDDDEEE